VWRRVHVLLSVRPFGIGERTHERVANRLGDPGVPRLVVRTTRVRIDEHVTRDVHRGRTRRVATAIWVEIADSRATITVKQQTYNGVTTTPKGRTRRTVPMTSALYEALKRMSTIREGFVVRNLDGSQKTDGEANWWLARICRRAGLPVRYWHTLRHNTESAIIRRGTP
jgi:integrase